MQESTTAIARDSPVKHQPSQCFLVLRSDSDDSSSDALLLARPKGSRSSELMFLRSREEESLGYSVPEEDVEEGRRRNPWLMRHCNLAFMFVELASITTESSSHCRSCNRNSVWWLMSAIGIHPLLGADEVMRLVAICSHCS
jgi:hypothetical protein